MRDGYDDALFVALAIDDADDCRTLRRLCGTQLAEDGDEVDDGRAEVVRVALVVDEVKSGLAETFGYANDDTLRRVKAAEEREP